MKMKKLTCALWELMQQTGKWAAFSKRGLLGVS
jgi:hypothetical protein